MCADYIPKDVARGRRLLEQAEILGSAVTKANLGTLYHRGEDGFPKSAVRAKQLYVDRAKEWNTTARTQLAMTLLHGHEQDAVDLTTLPSYSWQCFCYVLRCCYKGGRRPRSFESYSLWEVGVRHAWGTQLHDGIACCVVLETNDVMKRVKLVW